MDTKRPESSASASRIALRAGLAVLALAANAAAGRDFADPVPLPPGAVPPSELPPIELVNRAGDPFSLQVDPGQFSIEGDPTGGIVFWDTSGPDAYALTESFGLEVRDYSGGVCGGEPPHDTCSYTDSFNAWLLCEILNALDSGCGAEPDTFMRPPEGSQSYGSILGSDYGRSQFPKQPALAAVRAKPAHRLATGAGVVVAVLDTGIDRAHPLLGRRVIDGGWDFVDGDANPDEAAPDGEDQDGDGRADDGFGHGTTVAGLVLAAAPGTAILPIRVLDTEGVGSVGRVSSGILWALDHGADVVNLSLGGGDSALVRDALSQAQDAGVVVVAAAGNGRDRSGVRENIDHPAAVESVLAVSGGASFTGDVWAPARAVIGPYPGDRWYRGTGTSFATALASGGVALALQEHPGYGRPEILSLLGARKARTVPLDLLKLAR